MLLRLHRAESSNFGPQLLLLEQRIIDAHDPVIAIDRTHKRLVTQRSLEILRKAGAWTAQAANGCYK